MIGAAGKFKTDLSRRSQAKTDPLQDELPLSTVASHLLFPGRTVLYAYEVAAALCSTVQHICDLCGEGRFPGAINIAGHNNKSARKHWRIPVSGYDYFIQNRDTLPK